VMFEIVSNSGCKWLNISSSLSGMFGRAGRLILWAWKGEGPADLTKTVHRLKLSRTRSDAPAQ
jgi:hypothetical protein